MGGQLVQAAEEVVGARTDRPATGDVGLEVVSWRSAPESGGHGGEPTESATAGVGALVKLNRETDKETADNTDADPLSMSCPGLYKRITFVVHRGTRHY